MNMILPDLSGRSDGCLVCAYCDGSGEIDQDMLAIPAGATGLTSNLSEAERESFINNYSKEEPDALAEKREGCLYPLGVI